IRSELQVRDLKLARVIIAAAALAGLLETSALASPECTRAVAIAADEAVTDSLGLALERRGVAVVSPDYASCTPLRIRAARNADRRLSIELARSGAPEIRSFRDLETAAAWLDSKLREDLVAPLFEMPDLEIRSDSRTRTPIVPSATEAVEIES